MTTKKVVKKAAKLEIPVRSHKKKQQTIEQVVELDAATVLKFLGELNANIKRSNDVIAQIGHPAKCDTASPSTPPNQSQAVGTNATRPTLPPLECLVLELAAKCRAVYGFSHHMREEIQDCGVPESSFDSHEPSLKGILEMAYRMLDAAHDNMIASRNTIVSI